MPRAERRHSHRGPADWIAENDRRSRRFEALRAERAANTAYAQEVAARYHAAAAGRGDADVLVRVEAPTFVAGLVVRDDRCVAATPVLAWAIGATRDALRGQFQRRGWKATICREAVQQVVGAPHETN